MLCASCIYVNPEAGYMDGYCESLFGEEMKLYWISTRTVVLPVLVNGRDCCK